MTSTIVTAAATPLPRSHEVFMRASVFRMPYRRTVLAFASVVLGVTLMGCPDPTTPSPEPSPSTEPSVAPGVEPGVEPGIEPPDGGVTDAGPVVLPDAGPTDAGPGVVDAGPPPNVCVSEEAGPGFQISQKARLRWKRDRAVERDLMTAFGLSSDEVCGELGAAICYSAIHRVPLGGHEPVVTAMYKGIDAPGATTPISFDRVVISACGARVDLDTVAHLSDTSGGFGTANLYRHYRLDASVVSSSSDAVRNQITDLYRRALARDPTSAEVDLVASLADADPDTGVIPTARDFSKMACYAVTSSAEFLFQ